MNPLEMNGVVFIFYLVNFVILFFVGCVIVLGIMSVLATGTRAKVGGVILILFGVAYGVAHIVRFLGLL